MISTENNNALEEVQKEKLEIQELNTKFKNFDNDPEFKESLVEVLISNVATDHNIVEFYDYYKSEVTKYKGLCREFLEKSRSMDDDTKDLFWFLIASLVRLVHTMYNEDYNELELINSHFTYVSGDGIQNLISKIDNEVVVDDPILDEMSFFGFLNELFTDVNIYSQKNESGGLSFSDKKGFVKLNFKNLLPIGFSEFINLQSSSKDKLENHFIKSQKFKLLFGKYFRFVISHISFSDCGGDEETRAKLKERFLSDPNLKDFLSGELEAYTTTLLDKNWNKLYPWSS